MTCIVGLVDKGMVYIGADSGAADSVIVRPSDTSKVFARGHFLIGYTHSFRAGQLLQYKLEVGDQPQGMEDEEYMVTYFAESVRHCLKEGGVARIDSNVESGSNFLVGYRGKLWEIDYDFQVNSFGDYNAVGSGIHFALGSLYSTQGRKADKRVLMALESAANFSQTVIPPFRIMRIK